MKADIDDSEQYTRRNCLIFAGLTEEDEGENTDELVRGVCKEKLDIDLDVSDIDRSHRLGTALRRREGDQRSGRPRNLIVKFTNYRAREKVYGARMKLRKFDQKIFINENLTKERSQLFWKIKKANKNKDHQIWTQDGTIVVKSPNGTRIKIARESDLSKLSDLNL